MPEQRFAILEHATDVGLHHDLLVEDPDAAPSHPGTDAGDARTLWAARIDPPPSAWAELGRLKLALLPHHRHRYLTYEGPIAGGRGSVRRVAAGSAQVLAWDASQIRLRLMLWGRPLDLAIDRSGADRAEATVRVPAGDG